MNRSRRIKGEPRNTDLTRPKSLFLTPPEPTFRFRLGRICGRVFGGLQDGFA
jgi:hypothetical protein